MDLEHFRISEQHQRMIEQLKYLISLDPKLVKNQLLNLLNKLQPFSQYPLDNPPPIQFYQIDKQQSKIISQDLKTQLKSYCYIILRGSLIISRQNYQFSQQKYLDDQNIRQKSVYNFDQGISKLTAVKNSVYLKIHMIWIKKAKKKYSDKQKQYIRNKLIANQYFSKLTFQQFNQCCNKAYIKKMGPQQILIKQLQTPYNMYIVAEGQLCLQTRVKFTQQQSVWNQVRSQIKKNNQFCEQLFQYLVREPRQNDSVFQVDFSLKQIHEGGIVGAKQTLLQQPLKYSIKSTLSTKVICIKYPDLYVLKQQRLAQIRNWPYQCEIDKKQLRKQYYEMMNWNEFKQFIREQNKLNKIQRIGFDGYLRKDVDLNSKRYNYASNKIGQGKIIQSPAGKVIRMNNMAYMIKNQINTSQIS